MQILGKSIQLALQGAKGYYRLNIDRQRITHVQLDVRNIGDDLLAVGIFAELELRHVEVVDIDDVDILHG